MLIYLDTSAAMKLVRREVHSDELSRWLSERPGVEALSSVLIEVELMRATRRSAPDREGRAAEVLRGIGTVTLSPSVIARAAACSDPSLRSLDAIHLATAQHVTMIAREELLTFIAYDVRLIAAAQSAGLSVVAPGLP